MKVDCLIVGAGLAGIILADHLLHEGYSVKIYDKQAGTESSKVAAGMVNPVTGRRMVKSWNFDAFSQYALEYYRNFEKQEGIHIVFERPIRRFFHNRKQHDEWQERVNFDNLGAILKGTLPEKKEANYNDEYGGVETLGSWRLDTQVFIDSILASERFKDIYNSTQFNYNQPLKEVRQLANNIIFCEGWRLRENPWFNYLPIAPNKGELLVIKSNELKAEFVAMKGVFIQPLGNAKFKVGATYNREEINLLETGQARDWLLERLDNLINCTYSVVDQEVGVRPATIDRRPFLGTHPKHNFMHVFNGFGSKGVSLIPLHAAQFVNYLGKGVQLEKEVCISRFKYTST